MDRGAALNCRVVHNWNENEVKLEDETSELKDDNPDEKPVKK